MISRAPRHFCTDTAKPQVAQIKTLDKGINHADRVVLLDPIFKAFREKRRLVAVNPRRSLPYAGPNRIRFDGFVSAAIGAPSEVGA